MNAQNIKPGFNAIFGSLGAGKSIHTIKSVSGDLITLENGEVHNVSVPVEYREPVKLSFATK